MIRVQSTLVAPRWLCAWLILALAGCPAQGLQTVPTEAQARLLEQIHAEIGSAACSNDAECRTLPIGAKACGGPTAWLPWSQAATTKSERLQAWAQELQRLQRQHNERSGLLSNCQFLADPGASCVAQRCVLRGRAGAV